MTMLRNTSRPVVSASRKMFAAQSVRTKVSLPELDYDFGALEPHISGQINELHYTKHHQTYVNTYNQLSGELSEAVSAGDRTKQNHLLPLVNFHAGGSVNHDLWWKSLAPTSQGGGESPAESSGLAKAISSQYGSLDNLTGIINTKLAGVQGSGWAWIVKNDATGNLDTITTANQDIVPKGLTPILGIDAWEHAYYLQYKNVKADYFKAVWNVINWKEAAKRFDA